MVLFECLEKLVTRFGRFQCFIGEVTFKAIQDAPIVGISRHGIHLLELQVHATGVLITDDIVGTGIAEELGKVVLSANCIPVAAIHCNVAQFQRTPCSPHAPYQ